MLRNVRRCERRKGVFVVAHQGQRSRKRVFELLAVLLIRHLADEDRHEIDDGFGFHEEILP